MNWTDHLLSSLHYHNPKHRTLTYTSWNIQKVIAKFTGRYQCIKTETGLILQEIVEYERPITSGEDRQ